MAKNLLCVCLGMLALGLHSGAFAGLTDFELDGNAIINNPTSGLPDDWERLYNSAGHQELWTNVLVDPSGVTCFVQGSKDILAISTWAWANQAVPDKDEILDAYGAIYADEDLYFGADRFATNGTAYVGFWLLQGDIGLNLDGTFYGDHVVGDILILSTLLGGGGNVYILVYKWVGPAGSPSALELVAADSTQALAIVNITPEFSPWPYIPKVGMPGTFPIGAFFEGGVDLNALGVVGCFTSFLCETRSSAELSAELKDFVLGYFPWPSSGTQPATWGEIKASFK